MKIKNIWAVIPAYNEEKNIKGVIQKTKKYVKNIIVMDDGSNDKTYEAAKSTGVIVLRHIVNLGKGAGLKTGCDFALKQGADAIIILDADAQHEPAEIPNFLKELENADVVIGYRKRGKSMPLVFKFGNWFIHFMMRLLFGINVKDTQCGYRAFTPTAYRKIKWVSSDYSCESEMTANIGKNNLKFKEVPIQTIYSDKYKGTTVIDGLRIVLNMVWWRITK